MARFDMEQATAWVAIQQLINDWGHELDANNGMNIAGLVTQDCAYTVRGVKRNGPDEVKAFYTMRLAEFADAGKEPPIQRHVNSNLRVAFLGPDRASAHFTLVYFTTAMMAAGADAADPVAVADVSMEAQRGSDGEWRIAIFDSVQTLVRKTG
jgi:uncharacterized protein (TIGR02246 family)